MPTYTESARIIFSADDRAYRNTLTRLRASAATDARAMTFAWAAAGGGLFLAARAAIQFEYGLAKVAKTTDMNNVQLAEMAKNIRVMAKETPFTTRELLEIARAAGQMGIRGVENLTRFTNVIAKMGTATNLSGEQAAFTLSRILAVTGESVDKVENLASAIVDLGNKFAANESEIAHTSLTLAGMAANAGLAAADVLGLATAVNAAGQQSQVAATAFGKTFLRMNKAIAEGGQISEQIARVIGMTSTEFRKLAEEDTATASVLFLKALNEMDRGAQTFLESIEMNDSRTNRILIALSQNYEQVARAIEVARIAWAKKTALNEEYNRILKTTQAQLQIARNRLQDAFITLGNRILPVLNEVIAAWNAWTKGDEGTARLAGTLLTLGKLALAIGSVRLAMFAFGRAARFYKAGMAASAAATTLFGKAVGFANFMLKRFLPVALTFAAFEWGTDAFEYIRKKSEDFIKWGQKRAGGLDRRMRSDPGLAKTMGRLGDSGTRPEMEGTGYEPKLTEAAEELTALDRLLKDMGLSLKDLEEAAAFDFLSEDVAEASKEVRDLEIDLRNTDKKIAAWEKKRADYLEARKAAERITSEEDKKAALYKLSLIRKLLIREQEALQKRKDLEAHDLGTSIGIAQRKADGKYQIQIDEYKNEREIARLRLEAEHEDNDEKKRLLLTQAEALREEWRKEREEHREHLHKKLADFAEYERKREEEAFQGLQKVREREREMEAERIDHLQSMAPEDDPDLQHLLAVMEAKQAWRDLFAQAEIEQDRMKRELLFMQAENAEKKIAIMEDRYRKQRAKAQAAMYRQQGLEIANNLGQIFGANEKFFKALMLMEKGIAIADVWIRYSEGMMSAMAWRAKLGPGIGDAYFAERAASLKIQAGLSTALIVSQAAAALKMATGGLVPGFRGGDRHPALLEAGETVTPRRNYADVEAGIRQRVLDEMGAEYDDGGEQKVLIEFAGEANQILRTNIETANELGI